MAFWKRMFGGSRASDQRPAGDAASGPSAPPNPFTLGVQVGEIFAFFAQQLGPFFWSLTGRAPAALIIGIQHKAAWVNSTLASFGVGAPTIAQIDAAARGAATTDADVTIAAARALTSTMDEIGAQLAEGQRAPYELGLRVALLGIYARLEGFSIENGVEFHGTSYGQLVAKTAFDVMGRAIRMDVSGGLEATMRADQAAALKTFSQKLILFAPQMTGASASSATQLRTMLAELEAVLALFGLVGLPVGV